MTLAALIPDAASAARRNATWLDPKLLGGAIQVSRAVGWRFRCSPLAFSPPASECDKPEVESDEQNGDRELARAA